jgi:hypothetical protein
VAVTVSFHFWHSRHRFHLIYSRECASAEHFAPFLTHSLELRYPAVLEREREVNKAGCKTHVPVCVIMIKCVTLECNLCSKGTAKGKEDFIIYIYGQQVGR